MPPGKNILGLGHLIFSLMDSLRKITPRSSSAKGMLSVQFIVTEFQRCRRWITGVFPGS